MFSSIAEAQRIVGSAGFVGEKTLLERLVYQSGTGAPSAVVAAFIGQRYLDTSGNNWYSAYGTAAGEFKQDSN